MGNLDSQVDPDFGELRLGKAKLMIETKKGKQKNTAKQGE